MACDWIKFRKKLLRDGRVIALSRSCHAARVTVIGALVTLWCIADEYAEENGALPGYSTDDLDGEIGLSGFCKNLPTDWFAIDSDGLITLPNYLEHNGVTARKRDLATRRQASRRERDIPNGSMSRSARDKSVTREEKRREEKKEETPLPPLGGFGDFWSAYPKRKAKADALKAWNKLKPSLDLLATILQAIAFQKTTADWTKDDGKYIPLPASWLNGRRWEDELTPAVDRKLTDFERQHADYDAVNGKYLLDRILCREPACARCKPRRGTKDDPLADGAPIFHRNTELDPK